MKDLRLRVFLLKLFFTCLAIYLWGCASVPSWQGGAEKIYSPPKSALPVKIIGEENIGSVELNYPQGIAVDPSGNLYIVDSGNNRIVKCTREGEFIKEVGGFGWNNGEFNSPGYIAMDNGLSLYVSDTQNKRVQRFDNYFNFIQAISSFAQEKPFENSQLNGVAISLNGELYISDSENDCIWKLDPQFTSFDKLGGFESGAGALNDPQGMAVDAQGNLYVADSGNNRIAVFDPFGNYARELSSGELSRPYGVEVGRDGVVYVANTYRDNLVAFDQNGMLLFKFGKTGNGIGEFNKPKDLKIFQGDKIYIADSGNNRIQLLALIK
jgi:tripartite motif-containing protein 71